MFLPGSDFEIVGYCSLQITVAGFDDLSPIFPVNHPLRIHENGYHKKFRGNEYPSA
tara:strand:+ start:107 stop:274 length:168 start_codon:yes stop_codon:yes gene_type:complete